MWQATRKAAELIKLVTYCNNVNAYCVNLATHAQQQQNRKNAKPSRIVQKASEKE